jgi:hypothetical protein
METFTAVKSFVDNPEFHHQKKSGLKKLDFISIDELIVELIKDFSSWISALPCNAVIGILFINIRKIVIIQNHYLLLLYHMRLNIDLPTSPYVSKTVKKEKIYLK